MLELGQFNWGKDNKLQTPFQYGEKLCDIAMILSHPEYLSKPQFKSLICLADEVNALMACYAREDIADFPRDNKAMAITLHRAKTFLQCFVDNDRHHRIFQPPVLDSSAKRTISRDASIFAAGDGLGYIQLLDHMLEHMPRLSSDEKSNPDDVALLVRMPVELRQPRSNAVVR